MATVAKNGSMTAEAPDFSSMFSLLKSWDTDGDGCVTKEDFKQGLQTLGFSVSQVHAAPSHEGSRAHPSTSRPSALRPHYRFPPHLRSDELRLATQEEVECLCRALGTDEKGHLQITSLQHLLPHATGADASAAPRASPPSSAQRAPSRGASEKLEAIAEGSAEAVRLATFEALDALAHGDEAGAARALDGLAPKARPTRARCPPSPDPASTRSLAHRRRSRCAVRSASASRSSARRLTRRST